jgi:cysteine desulfurase
MRSGTLNVPGSSGSARPARNLPERDGRGKRPLRGLRDKLKDGCSRSSTRFHQRLDGSTACRTTEHQLRVCGRRIAADGHQRHCGVERFGLHLGNARTELRAEGAGVGEDLAHTSIRFGMGRFNTEEEVDYVTNRVIEVVQRLRELSPLYEMAKEGIDLSKMNWKWVQH